MSIRRVAQVSDHLLKALEDRRVRHAFKPDQQISFRDDCEIEPYAGVFRGSALPHRMGAFSYSNSPLNPDAVIGRYVSIAINFQVMGNAHPFEWLSTSPFSYGSWKTHPNIVDALEDAGLRETWRHKHFKNRRNYPTIGNDVWIGQDVLLAQAIKIGDGAVVAARSVVTKDVPPYTIVGGAPARTIRLRFSEQLVERLIASAWWQYRFTDFAGMDVTQPEAFLDELAERVATGAITKFEPQRLTTADLERIVS